MPRGVRTHHTSEKDHEEAPAPLVREQLEQMKLKQLKDLAESRGVVLHIPPKTFGKPRLTCIIEQLLEEAPPPPGESKSETDTGV